MLLIVSTVNVLCIDGVAGVCYIHCSHHNALVVIFVPNMSKLITVVRHLMITTMPQNSAQVFAYGYVDHDKVDGQWGCAAHAIGMLDGILKIIYGR